jgi:NitT/TauT family transport system substrate-binding protein
VQEQIAKWTGYPLPAAVIRRAWDELTFTYDPLPLTLKQDAEDAVSVGLLVLPPGGLNGIYDVRLLNSVLKGAGSRTVSSGGLGPQ